MNEPGTPRSRAFLTRFPSGQQLHDHQIAIDPHFFLDLPTRSICSSRLFVSSRLVLSFPIRRPPIPPRFPSLSLASEDEPVRSRFSHDSSTG
jgi:hypothetical protein